ncbi:MAG: 5,6-dimethylbenzimidazole synthase [Nitrosopumilaceae archaeon]|nr:5,6-dimethylbenzimidazole synthase [Nitrosopumilaceae archaeon]NIU00825.1 5,6-dimethylbenzimidazole synthase [Nitrosopumilaceae archaeon]NIU87278.1 5,6-dimethylbenzimidazole synthase [Nitrosopumilaceae archaeon]NIV65806.1 5,6-dimethylbenzimidazole synthase [Nitrosopumilaceae archaeon]NIX61427.1 5,6-dimethylbenzimidazole synthase [Nitrosopumilaceae archaeon]
MENDFNKEEKNGLYKAIFSRRDVRSNFISKDINTKVLTRILRAAHHAPSVGFSQPWNFILIKNHDTKKTVKESFKKEKQKAAKEIDGSKKSKYLSFKLEGILESPLNICVTYDPSKFGPFIIGKSSVPNTGLYSVCCAIQNLWLASRTEGIGVGWVSILSNDVLRKVLKIPDHIIPVAYLCLGYVYEFSSRPDLEKAKWLSRLSLDEVVFYEEWDKKQSPQWNEIKNMIKANLDYA